MCTGEHLAEFGVHPPCTGLVVVARSDELPGPRHPADKAVLVVAHEGPVVDEHQVGAVHRLRQYVIEGHVDHDRAGGEALVSEVAGGRRGRRDHEVAPMTASSAPARRSGWYR